jgi:hypothetical protein
MWNNIEQFRNDANEGIIDLIVFCLRLFGLVLYIMLFPVFFLAAVGVDTKGRPNKAPASKS